MKTAFIIISFFFTCPIFGQDVELLRIYNDTSLYFIHQIDSLKPVILSPGELAGIEEHLVKAINKFNRSQQRYADSLNPKKKKKYYQARGIDINHYFFQIIPKINKEGQKEVWVNGSCKSWFTIGRGKKAVLDPAWKRKFINGQMVDDGGSCFIYLDINLTLKTHSTLTMNGVG